MPPPYQCMGCDAVKNFNTTWYALETWRLINVRFVKKQWNFHCFSLECGYFIYVAYEDVNVTLGDVCDV